MEFRTRTGANDRPAKVHKNELLRQKRTGTTSKTKQIGEVKWWNEIE